MLHSLVVAVPVLFLGKVQVLPSDAQALHGSSCLSCPCTFGTSNPASHVLCQVAMCIVG